MRYKSGDRIRLRDRKSKTGKFIRYSTSGEYEVVVVWDKTNQLEFVREWDIERCEDGCG